jgi:hypothetical protein
VTDDNLFFISTNKKFNKIKSNKDQTLNSATTTVEGVYHSRLHRLSLIPFQRFNKAIHPEIQSDLLCHRLNPIVDKNPVKNSGVLRIAYNPLLFCEFGYTVVPAEKED